MLYSETDEQSTKIYFVGDGYFSKNQFQNVFESLAESGGHETTTGLSVFMMGTLSQHAEPGRTFNMNNNNDWDYIVLQENIATAESRLDMYQAIRTLNEAAAANGAKTILFIPWAYPAGYPAQDYRAMDAMQETLIMVHFEIGKEIGAVLAPGGEAWKSARVENPSLVLRKD